MATSHISKKVLIQLARLSEERLLLDLPQLLSTSLGTSVAYIGLFKGDERQTLTAEYLYAKLDTPDDYVPKQLSYPVAGSPCATTLLQGRLTIPDGCCDTFSQSPLLTQLKIRGYAAVTLQGGNGNKCGVLAVLSRQPLADADQVLALLDLLKDRVSAALENSRKQVASHKKNSLLRGLLNAVPYPIFCKDHTGRYLECNSATEELLGLSRQELRQKSMHEVAPGGLISDCHTTEQQIITGEKSETSHEGPMTLPSGEVRKFKFYKAGLSHDGEKLRAVACSFLDITVQDQAYTQIEEKQNFLQSIIDNVGETIMVVALDKSIMLLNRQAMRNLAPEFLSRPLYCHNLCQALATPCRGGNEPCPVDEALRCGDRVTIMQRVEAKDGKIDLYETVASPYKNSHNQVVGVIHSSRNVSERDTMLSQLNAQRQELQFLAYHDHLTQLPNRLYFQERLHTAFARCQREDTCCALMFLDLDRFKVINDSLGHDIGDLVLKKVAERLKKIIRGTDTVARFGGDEFLILIEDIREVSQISQIARKLIGQFESPVQVRDLQLFPTASVGICLSSREGNDAESLIKNAEVAMYRGKADGRNSFTFYDRTMDCFAHEQLELENKLRQAITNGELQLYFQPQIGLTDHKIIGFEGLLRWDHPGKGVVLPEHFIPLAEETGLITVLGELCITQACRFICPLNDLGLRNFHVAVNISPRHFRQNGFIDFIRNTLNTTGANPAGLELEITEGTIMEDAEMASSKMTHLSRMGISLAIDDFGTGYSSLAYLQKFPVNKLKIDRAFVSEICEGNPTSPLISMIVALANSMNLQALAEGVETKIQIESLLEIGCTQVQGFFFSHALPEQEALNYVEHFSTQHNNNLAMSQPPPRAALGVNS